MKQKDNDAIKLAASIMGKAGGRSRSERKIAASKSNIQKALSALTADDRRGTHEMRRAAQLTIPKDERIERAKKAVSARWGNRESSMSNDQFRMLTDHYSARQIAEITGVSVGAVYSYRRKVNPVSIPSDVADKVKSLEA